MRGVATVMMKISLSPHILRDWNFHWTSQPELKIHLEATQDLRLQSHCALNLIV